MSYYKEQLKDWLKDQSVDANNVLSIGNLNDDSKYFKHFRAIGLSDTLDIDPTLKPTITWDMNLPFDVAQIKLPYNPKGLYEHVFTFELWEYIYDPLTALRNCHNFLKERGYVWISAPFIYPAHNPSDADYLRYTKAFWEKVLPLAGFKIIQYKPRVWSNAIGFMQSVGNDGMRPAKDVDHKITGHLIIAQKV